MRSEKSNKILLCQDISGIRNVSYSWKNEKIYTEQEVSWQNFKKKTKENNISISEREHDWKSNTSGWKLTYNNKKNKKQSKTICSIAKKGIIS